MVSTRSFLIASMSRRLASFHAMRQSLPLLLLAAAAQALALAWPWAREGGWLSLPGGYGRPLWWLQIASLALLARSLQAAQGPAQAAARAWVFATAWLAAAFWWLFVSMHVYGGLAAPLAALAVLALAFFLGGYYALAAWVWARVRPLGTAAAALAFAAAWTLAELARACLWTGFPWGAGGYAHVEGPLAVLPRWVGVYGTGAVAAWLAYWLAYGLRGVCQVRAACPRTIRKLALWSTAACLAWALLWWLRASAVEHGGVEHSGVEHSGVARPTLHVALLQGNIAQDEKFQSGSGVPLALHWYGRTLLQAAQAPAQGLPRLVVAPETAIPLLPQHLPAEFRATWQRLHGAYTQPGGTQAALIGLPLGAPQQGYSNSVLGWQPVSGPQARDYRYDKRHLVPFGEFVPPLFRWFVALLDIPLGDFARGAARQAPMLWAGEALAPNICYEDLFGEELAAAFADAARAPTVLVNVSNIAWFGNTVALDQHLAIGRMRALELERPMLRATNTGATAIIDHRGVVVQALPAAVRAVLHGSVQGRGHGGSHVTPFAYWAARTGLLPLWLACAAVLALCGWYRRGKPS